MTKLPNGWEVKKLKDIFDIERGGSPRPIKEYLTDDINGINWIKISDINNQKYIYETKEKIIEEGLKKSKLVVEGDFLISNSMSFGKPVIVKMSKGAIHDGWLLLREKITLSKDYFYYLFCSDFMYSLLSSKAAGSTVKNLNINMVKELEVPLPPIEEQRKIVKILDEKFASIDESIRLVKDDLLSLDELWQSILNDSFNPLKSKLDNDTYTLPPTWKWKKLGDIAQVVTGTTPSKKKEEFYGVGYPLFKPSDLDDGYELFSGSDNLTPLGFENARQFPINTTLVVCIGATIGKVGLTRVEGSCNQQINAILPNENFNSEYLYFLCLSPYFQMILKANASQTTLPIINKTEFIKLQIPLPPLKEQERIAKELESKAKTIKELKELYTKRLKDYEELKESLLDLAFKGGL